MKSLPQPISWHYIPYDDAHDLLLWRLRERLIRISYSNRLPRSP